MNIYYKTKKLEQLCNNYDALVRRYGERQAKKIRIRLNALRSAKSLHDFSPPERTPERCHELLQGRKKGDPIKISMDLVHPYRLIFTPDHNPVPCKVDGGLDWGGVTDIEIWGVEDTHDHKKK